MDLNRLHSSIFREGLDIMRLIPLLSLLFITVSLNFEAISEEKVSDDFCAERVNLPSPIRQTQIIIDASMITPEANGAKPDESNRLWRQRLVSLLDASDPSALRKWGSREPVTVSIAEADGSGLRPIFSGCMPLYSTAEKRDLNSKTSSFSRFVGRDWESEHEKVIEQFRRSLTFAVVMAAKDQPARKKSSSFIKSGLGQAIARGFNTSLDSSPRVIILTDLDNYKFDINDSKKGRAEGKANALGWGADLGLSEIHILGVSGETSNATKDYLKSLFLASRGNILTMTGINGALPLKSIPDSLRVYQGTVSFPDTARKDFADFPITMTLSLDKNNRAVNSWIELEMFKSQFVPLEGTLTCLDKFSCKFIDVGDFAQVWSDSPGGEPEFTSLMPFVGFRDISFTLSDNDITGNVSDSTGYVLGLGKEGFKFRMALMSDRGSN